MGIPRRVLRIAQRWAALTYSAVSRASRLTPSAAARRAGVADRDPALVGRPGDLAKAVRESLRRLVGRELPAGLDARLALPHRHELRDLLLQRYVAPAGRRCGARTAAKRLCRPAGLAPAPMSSTPRHRPAIAAAAGSGFAPGGTEQLCEPGRSLRPLPMPKCELTRRLVALTIGGDSGPGQRG